MIITIIKLNIYKNVHSKCLIMRNSSNLNDILYLFLLGSYQLL